MTIRTCPSCRRPIVYVYDPVTNTFVPVLLARNREFIFDMNPVYDQKIHEHHGYCVAGAWKAKMARHAASKTGNPKWRVRAMLEGIEVPGEEEPPPEE